MFLFGLGCGMVAVIVMNFVYSTIAARQKKQSRSAIESHMERELDLLEERNRIDGLMLAAIQTMAAAMASKVEPNIGNAVLTWNEYLNSAYSDTYTKWLHMQLREKGLQKEEHDKVDVCRCVNEICVSHKPDAPDGSGCNDYHPLFLKDCKAYKPEASS